MGKVILVAADPIIWLGPELGPLPPGAACPVLPFAVVQEGFSPLTPKPAILQAPFPLNLGPWPCH